MSFDPLYCTIIFFIVIMSSIFYLKPSFAYDKNKKLKSFGISKDTTLIPLPMLAMIIAIFIYAIFFYIKSINKLSLNMKGGDGYMGDNGRGSISGYPNNIGPTTYRLVKELPNGELYLV